MDAVFASLWPVLQLLIMAFTLQLACGSHIATVSGRAVMTTSLGTGQTQILAISSLDLFLLMNENGVTKSLLHGVMSLTRGMHDNILSNIAFCAQVYSRDALMA